MNLTSVLTNFYLNTQILVVPLQMEIHPKLFKSRPLRSTLLGLQSAEAIIYHGIYLRPPSGLMVRSLRKRMNR